MPINHNPKRGKYTRVENCLVTDLRLSGDAVRIAVYLLGKPASWVIQVDDVSKQLGITKNRVYRLFIELIAAGYMEREKHRDGGRFKAVSYVFHESPITVSPKQVNGDPVERETGDLASEVGRDRDTVSPQLVSGAHSNTEESVTFEKPKKEQEKTESLTRESAPQTDEREIDLPFAIRSRINDFANFERHKPALIKEIERLGVEKAVEILEARCFGRADVRDWYYMVTTLRNEPPLEDEFVAIMQASATPPVPVEVQPSAPPVALKAEAPAPPKPIEPVLPAAQPKPLPVESPVLDELSPEHDWITVRRSLCGYLGKLNHAEAQAAQAALNCSRLGGYEGGVFKLIAPDADSKRLLEQLHRQIYGELRRQAKNFAKAVEIEVAS